MTAEPSSISSSERFDQIRAEHPELAINLYALLPGGEVIFEVITPDGTIYKWAAPNAAAAMALAFPPFIEFLPTPNPLPADIFG